MDTKEHELEQVLKILRALDAPVGVESLMQAGIAEALLKNGVVHRRERKLDHASRIDFSVGRIGIECKAACGAGTIARQLLRYALTGEFDHLVLVTSKAVGLPPFFNYADGKDCQIHLVNVSLYRL